MTEFILYLGIGVLAGVLGGMLGIGGGLVIVPSLAFLFGRQGMSSEHGMHLAIGTSLACVVCITASSAYHQWKRGAIERGLFALLAPANLAGGFAAGLVAARIPGDWLRVLFATFMLLVSVQLASGWRPDGDHPIPGKAVFAIGGFFIGALSALLGVGGGTLTVPFLLYCGVQMRHAIGTSSALGVLIGLAGTLGYLFSGWGRAVQDGTLGFLYWPAFLPIAVLAVLCAPMGVHLAHRLPVPALRRIFAAFLAVVAVRMFLTS